jgi:uncharacterized protein (TIGR03083 family)
VLRFDVPMGDLSVPLLRQRRRLAARLADLDIAQWAAPSRCEAWRVQDVIAHLVGTNQFWTLSVASALRGEPTQFLATFDPVATPAQMVDSARSQTAAEVLDRYTASTEDLAGAIAAVVDAGAWDAIGEAPPGHVSLVAVALHALWDAWIHERDVLLPLGLDPAREPDEIVACLHYAAAIGPALAATAGAGREGAIVVEATDPDVRFVVDVGEVVTVRDADPPPGAARLAGSSVDLVEELTFRAPWTTPIADDARWLFAGLADVFDRAGA